MLWSEFLVFCLDDCSLIHYIFIIMLCNCWALCPLSILCLASVEGGDLWYFCWDVLCGFFFIYIITVIFSLIRTSDQSLREKECFILINHKSITCLQLSSSLSVFLLSMCTRMLQLLFFFFCLPVGLPVSKRQKKINKIIEKHNIQILIYIQL